MRIRPAPLALAVLTLGAAPAMAQSTSPPTPTTVLSIQPLSAMFNVYAAEAEHTISPNTTFGAGVTYAGGGAIWDGVHILSTDVKLRFYPEGHPLRGFALGGQLGYTSISDDQASYDFNTNSYTKTTTSGPTFGVSLDYNWLLGQSRSFYIGLGLGAKRIFAKDDVGNDHYSLAYPTGRISVGFAF